MCRLTRLSGNWSLPSARPARSKAYLRVLNLNLAKLVAHFDGKIISTITTQDIEQFLAGLNVSPGTWNTIRRDVVTLWSFAQKARLVQENVAKATERATAIDEPPGILLPEQAEHCWRNRRQRHRSLSHAIGLFAGLRVTEIKALDWRDVDLAGGSFMSARRFQRPRSRRLVPILDNLAAWLQPVAKPSGPIVEWVRDRHELAGEACWDHGMATKLHEAFLRELPFGGNRQRSANRT